MVKNQRMKLKNYLFWKKSKSFLYFKIVFRQYALKDYFKNAPKKMSTLLSNSSLVITSKTEKKTLIENLYIIIFSFLAKYFIDLNSLK